MEYRHIRIRVLVNDDIEVYREGLIQTIRSEPAFQLAAVTTSTEELLKAAETNYPDVVITAVQSKNIDGIAATRRLLSRFPELPVLAISMFRQQRSVAGILQAGAQGCVLRTATKDSVIEAIKALHKGENYFSHEVIAKLSGLIANKDFKTFLAKGDTQLTKHDEQLLRLLCQQFSTKQIAQKLNLSKRTVENRKHRLFSLLNISNSSGLIVYAITNGIFNPFDLTNKR